MASNDVCEHQNANYLRMMSERDELRAEVERLRREVAAGIETERGSNATARRLLAEARQQLADLRAGVEALADEYDDHRRPRGVHRFAVADRLRALAGSGEVYGPRPAACCGKCPPIEGGGYDCTCEGNPRCARERVRRALAGAVVDSEPVNAYASRPITFGEGASGALLDDLTDAVLAVVGQGVTARRPGCCQGWEWTPSGVVDALSGVERFDQEPCKHNHSAVVGQDGQEGS